MLSQTTSTHSFSWSDWGLFLLLVSLQIFSLPADVHCLPVSRVSYLPVVLSHWYIPSLAHSISGSHSADDIRNTSLLFNADVNGLFEFRSQQSQECWSVGRCKASSARAAQMCTCWKPSVLHSFLFTCQHLAALCALPLPASFACQVRWCQSTKLSCMKLNSTVLSRIVTTKPTAYLHFVCACVCACISVLYVKAWV